MAAAIQDLAPTVSLLVAKVFDTSLTSSVRALVPAIGWADGPRRGPHQPEPRCARGRARDVLRDAVAEAARHGAVIVAAGEHEGVRWLPGTLDDVLRVELDWTQPRGRFACERRDGEVVFRTCGYPRPIPGVSPERNLKGLSFAVANMTGIAAGVMAETGVGGVVALVEALERRAWSTPPIGP